MGVFVLISVLVVLLVSGGDNDDGSNSTATGAPRFSPSSPDETEIVTLARNSIEVLPRGEWPSLYDSFTPDYQARCPREEFVAAGEASAEEQGENLPLLAFVDLEDLSIDAENATAVIVGEIMGVTEYRVSGAFQKVEGAWKLSPAAGTEGCAAFNRVGS